MRNSVLLQRDESVEISDFIIKPINRYDIDKVNELISNNPDFFYYKLLDDDYRYENLSFKEYGDSSYWDILLILNLYSETMYALPKNFGYIKSKCEEINNKMEAYFQNLDADKNLQTLLEKEEALNDERRKVRFIRKEYIPTFSEALKDCVYEY